MFRGLGRHDLQGDKRVHLLVFGSEKGTNSGIL